MVDRVFGVLLALGGIGHGLGAFKVYGKEPMVLLWALSGSFAIFLLAAINLLRTGRKGDRALAWVSAAGCVVWIGFALRVGQLIGNMFDFRPMVNVIVALVLAIFSVRSALQEAEKTS